MPTQKYVPQARLTCQAIQAIARTLKTLEERSGQSRESFARQIGVTPLTYRRLVAGKANPMILLLHSIACRLGITLEQLLGFQPLDPAGSGEAKADQDARRETTQRESGRHRLSTAPPSLVHPALAGFDRRTVRAVRHAEPDQPTPLPGSRSGASRPPEAARAEAKRPCTPAKEWAARRPQ